jgi:hypothetical protein
MEIEYEYRIVIDTIETLQGWSKDFNAVIAHAIELREVNPHSVISIEISPWYWEGGNYQAEKFSPTFPR